MSPIPQHMQGPCKHPHTCHLQGPFPPYPLPLHPRLPGESTRLITDWSHHKGWTSHTKESPVQLLCVAGYGWVRIRGQQGALGKQH